MNNSEIKFDGEIKLNTDWIKTIKINKYGDTIDINLNDISLIDRYQNLLSEMQKIISDNNNLSSDILSENEKISKYSNISKFLTEKIDLFFNKPICIKIFGTDKPFLEDILLFVDQFSEYLSKFSGEKINSIKDIQKKYTSKQKRKLSRRI